MKVIQEVEIASIGTVTFKRVRRSKHIRVVVTGKESARVTFPYWGSYAKAHDFLLSKCSWIRAQQQKMAALKKYRQEQLAMCGAVSRIQARKILLPRVHHLSARYAFQINRIAVRDQRTRWGSCSAKKNINLNYRLVYLPEYLRDYVILHELAHTKIQNHSKQFWDYLDEFVPEAKKVDAELRAYSYLLV